MYKQATVLQNPFEKSSVQSKSKNKDIIISTNKIIDFHARKVTTALILKPLPLEGENYIKDTGNPGKKQKI